MTEFSGLSVEEIDRSGATLRAMLGKKRIIVGKILPDGKVEETEGFCIEDTDLLFLALQSSHAQDKQAIQFFRDCGIPVENNNGTR